MNPDLHSARFQRSLQTAIALPVAVILLAAGLLLAMVLALFHVIRVSDGAHEVRAQAWICEKTLLDLETGVRGYLLQRDPAFLAPFAASLHHVDGDFLQLRALAAENHDQIGRVDPLIDGKNRWLSLARGMMIAVEAGRSITPADLTASRALMDEERVRFAEFDAREEALGAQRQHDVVRMKEVLLLAVAGLSGLLVLAIGYVVRREFDNLEDNYRLALASARDQHQALERSDADLEKQKEWFRVTLTSIGDGVIVADPEGRVVFMNHEAERLTGWTTFDALLQPLGLVSRILNEETRQSMQVPIARVLREGTPGAASQPALLVSKAGDECPVEQTAAPILDAQGEALGVVVVLHSALEERKVQRALRVHSAELEEKVRERTLALEKSVGELRLFSSTVSHDLRSPLRAMQGFAQALLEDCGDQLNEEGRNYLDRIQKAAARLDRLIQDLLAYTRISRQSEALGKVDLDRLVRSMIDDYPNLQPPAAKVEIEGTLPTVLAQEALLVQVLSNLLGNGAKFVPAGVMAQLRIHAETQGATVRIWVCDNGIGIDEKDLGRIFDMFVRVDETQSYSGTGVGLAIVKKGVEAMRGEVGVESAMGKGSRFWIELPAGSP